MTRLAVILILAVTPSVLAVVLARLAQRVPALPDADPDEPIQTDVHIEDVWLTYYERSLA